MLVLAVAEMFASQLFRSIVFLSLSNHLLSSLVCWCSAFCHITAACVSGKVHYAIPVLLLFVARCTYQAVRQGHPQPIGGAKSGWRRNARALRDDGKTKQNAPLPGEYARCTDHIPRLLPAPTLAPTGNCHKECVRDSART